MAPAVHTATVPARAGIAGNPSDGYGGTAVAVPVPSLAATVEVVDAATTTVVGGDAGGLLDAAVAVLTRWTGAALPPVELRWRTTVPREVGLGGSSALVIAALRALAARHGLDLDPRTVADLALSAEVDELGIAAGILDRAAQAWRCPIRVDTGGEGPWSVAELRPAAPLGFVVSWVAGASRSSGAVHGPLRERFDRGDRDVRASMAALATAGRDAAAAVEGGDLDGLATAMRITWRERERLAIVDDMTRALVEAAEASGAAATSAGSGGAAVALAPAGAELAAVEAAWRASLAGRSTHGARFAACDVRPSPASGPPKP